MGAKGETDIPHPCRNLLKMREYFSKRFRAVKINLPKINQLKEGVRNVGRNGNGFVSRIFESVRMRLGAGLYRAKHNFDPA
jgi:hypothetical protein